MIDVPGGLVDLAPGQRQSYVISVTPKGELESKDVPFVFSAMNAVGAPITPGVTTMLLSATPAPGPDVVALAATLDNDGTVRVSGPDGIGAFAVATINLGADAMISVHADTGGQPVAVALSLCQTEPSSGLCLSPVGSSVTTSIGTGDTPTFAIFVTAAGPVPFDPGGNRIFVRFKDTRGVVRGATSVAVRTD